MPIYGIYAGWRADHNIKGFTCKLRLNSLEPKKMIKDSRRLLKMKNQKK